MRNEEALNKFVAIVIDEQIYIISGSVARPMCSLILNGTTLESQTTDKNELTIENIIALVERDYINVGYE